MITPGAAQRWRGRRCRGQGLLGSSGGSPGVAWSHTDAPSAPAFQGEITSPSNEEGHSIRCLTASRKGKQSNYVCGTQGSGPTCYLSNTWAEVSSGRNDALVWVSAVCGEPLGFLPSCSHKIKREKRACHQKAEQGSLRMEFNGESWPFQKEKVDAARYFGLRIIF